MKKIILILMPVLSLTCACGPNLSSNVYSSGAVGEAYETLAGTVKNIRHVKVKASELGDQTGIGMAGGGVAGGLAGSTIGKGSGNAAAVLIGAIAGVVGGSIVEDRLSTQCAYEYIVELDEGGMLTIIQAPSEAIQVGQRVYVMISMEGRSRIIPG